MTEQQIAEPTGATLDQWAELIQHAGVGQASHKDMVEFLHASHSVSYWWAQELTVDHERRIGRRVIGLAQDGRFQVGARRTIDAPRESVWSYMQPDACRTAVLGEAAGAFAELSQRNGEDAEGVRTETTTFVPGARVRLQWHRLDWSSASILQVRVSEKSPSKTTAGFHQEKRPAEVTREETRERRRGVCVTIAGALS